MTRSGGKGIEIAMMDDSVNNQKSDITIDAFVSKQKKAHDEGILLIPRPSNDPLDPLVQPLDPSSSDLCKY